MRIRSALGVAVFCGAFAALLGGCTRTPPPAPAQRRPNIVLIMTDDQGWAQLGMRGGPVLRTPHLDRFAAESAEFTRFYASPVCAPTRASLLTGRDSYRTGVVDTYLGRAMMAPDEVTLAEVLTSAGYRTGIFGKWHLGDTYPLRPFDQGFQEAIVHLGGGIKQPSDPPGSDYTNPILFHNGVQQQYEGYCTDVFFDQAMSFMTAAGDQPFFAYIPTNAPHSPYLVPDSYREPYAALGLTDSDARIYGMITNIDDNVGQLLAYLDERGLAQDTIVVFMSDNGPTTQRFTAGLRDQKTSTFEGGIRVPFFLRWPARVRPARIDTIAAHIDVMPTLLDLAGVSPPGEVEMDGLSLRPLVDVNHSGRWPERTIYIQSHRGDVPDAFRNFAAIGPRYKLVEGHGFGRAPAEGTTPELFDIQSDPGEQHNLADRQPEIVAAMAREYESWFRDVSATRGFGGWPIWLGTEHENPVTLTRQDWHATGQDGWGAGSVGVWNVDVRSAGVYDVRVDLPPAGERGFPARPPGTRVLLRVGETALEQRVGRGQDQVMFSAVDLPAGRATIDARIESGADVQGAWFVHVRKR